MSPVGTRETPGANSKQLLTFACFGPACVVYYRGEFFFLRVVVTPSAETAIANISLFFSEVLQHGGRVIRGKRIFLSSLSSNS